MAGFKRRSKAGQRVQACARSLVESLESRLLLSTYMVTNHLDSGPGSLRGDIQMSNAAGGANTITFAVAGTITLTSGQLEISNDLTITGPGAASLTISGNNMSRVLQIDQGVTASISGVTVTGGRAPAGAAGAAGTATNLNGGTGGAGRNGGAIYNLGSLTLSADIISNSSAGVGGSGGAAGTSNGRVGQPGAGGPGGNGGGIYSSGTVNITGTTIQSDSAGTGGAAGGTGAQQGAAGTGGGVCIAGGIAAIDSSTITNCDNARRGGGIAVNAGDVIITASAIYMNSAGVSFNDGGGGIYSAGGLSLANDTVSFNTAQAGSGGGILSSGSLLSTNITVANNTNGGLSVSAGRALLNNSIVAANSLDVFGAVEATSAYNLIGDGSQMTGMATANHNQIGTDQDPINPVLSPLGNFGGPTQTMLPLPGSTAIDEGSNALAVGPDGKALTVDQRGQPRTVDALNTGSPTVDIGAAEAAALPASLTSPSTLVVTSAADTLDQVPSPASLSLRDAVGIADSLRQSRAITFSVSSGITLTNGPIEITGNVTITGPGASSLSINGNQQNRVFRVDGGAAATISGLTITGGHAPNGFQGAPASEIPGNLGGFPGGPGASGGGVYNLGTLTLSNDVITGNAAGDGGPGGVPVGPGSGGQGGAGGNCGGIYSVGNLTVLGCSIHDNRGGAGGQGLYRLMPPFAGVTAAGGGGGGVVVDSGTVAISGSMIFNNPGGSGSPPGALNGVVSNSANVSIDSSTISGGSGFSGSALQTGNGTIHLTSTTITGDVIFGMGSSGTCTNAVMGTITNNGNFSFTGCTTGNVTNSGTLDLMGGSLAIANNNAGGTMSVTNVQCGPLTNAKGAALSVAHSLIQGNFIPAILTNAGSATLTDCTVSGNTRGAGISNSGAISLARSTVKGNSSDGIFSNGGGIINTGTLSLTSTLVSGNSGFGAGGGIENQGNATLMDSQISGNSVTGNASFPTAPVTGGGFDNQGTATLTDCTISGNIATTTFTVRVSGGGIENHGSATLIGCTITGNSATTMAANMIQVSGGGIDSAGMLTLINSTISGNTITNGTATNSDAVGAGIFSSNTLRLTNCTISNNEATAGSSNTSDAVGGGIFASTGKLTLNNTLVAGNSTVNQAQNNQDDLDGAVDPTSGYNLIGAGDGATGLSASNHNLIGSAANPIDAMLGPLADNGGPTQTMALLAGSPAIDAGSNALAVGTDGKPLLTDQRSYYRIFNGTVDIGAYEFGSSAILLGDADADGKVDFADLVLVARNYGKTNATWFDGDFNGDGSVGFDDLLIVARNYGKSIGTTAAAAVFSASQVSPAVASIANTPAAVVKHRHTR